LAGGGGDEPLGGKSEITAEWLTDALREGGHPPRGRVRTVDVAEVGGGRGYISQNVRRAPTYEGAPDSAPASLVAKVPAFFELPAYLGPWAAMIIETEIPWSREASAYCAARVPSSFGGKHANRFSYTLLLEDRGHLGTLSRTESCPPERARPIVRALADVHPQWWEMDRLRAATWLPSTEQQAGVNAPLVAGGWDIFAERIMPKVDAGFMPAGERLVRDFGAIYERSAASAATLIHGDFRIENFLFGEPGSDDELVILDWQLAGYGSGPRDLACFIAQGIDRSSAALSMRSCSRCTTPRWWRTASPAIPSGGAETTTALGCWRACLDSAPPAFPLIGIQGAEALEPPPKEASAEDKRALDELLRAAETLMVMLAERNSTAVMDARAGELLGV